MAHIERRIAYKLKSLLAGEKVADREEIEINTVELTTNLTITSLNVHTYNGKLVYIPASVTTGDLVLTINEGADIEYMDVICFGRPTSFRIAGQNTVRVNGESDIRLTEFEGARIQGDPDDEDNYVVLFDNTDPDMTDNYVDTLSLVGQVLTMGRTGSLPDLTQDLSSLVASGSSPIQQVENHGATGVQNYGSEVAGRLHVLASTVTAFDLLISATIADNGLFAIQNQNTAEIEFDISAHAASFVGTVQEQAYDIAGGATVLFYASGTDVYVLADTGVGGAGGTGDHPVVLTRNTPSLTDLATLAGESLNDNSGFWKVASDQDATFEATVDGSIMIRSLRSGILDANGAEISTTSTAKSGVRLAGGTDVRVFSNTDLRVVSGPLMAAGARYPDIPTTLIAGQILTLTGNQALYNSYRNRTGVFNLNTAGTIEVRLPSLQNAFDLAYLNRNDVFCFRHDGTNGVVRVRTFQVGTTFSDGNQMIDLSPGQTLCISPAPSGSVWQILAFGQSSDISTETISINTDWYRDGVDATAADNSVRLHNRKEVVDGNVIDHVSFSSATSNPISVRWNAIDEQDDIAWVSWWSTWDGSVPPLGTMVEEIEANIPTALSYIQSNINNGFDFEFNAPDGLLTVQSIDFISGNEVRYRLDSGFISSSYAVNHPVTFTGAANSVHNGTFLIDAINLDSGNITLHVTNVGVSDGTSDEPTTAAIANIPVWARAVFVSHDLRQVNFNLYSDSGRTALRTSFNSEWFDHEVDPPSVASILNIGYNTDVQSTSPILALQNQDGEFYEPPHGPLRRATLVFNGDPNDNGPSVPEYLGRRPLPENYATMNLQTQGVALFYMPRHSSNIPVGESRQFRVFSDPDNDINDVSLGIGNITDLGWNQEFDGDIPGFSILPGSFVDIEGYNDGTLNGWRIVSPFQKTTPSINVYSSPVSAFTSYIPMNVASQVFIPQNEDQNGIFQTTGNDRLQMRTALEYRIQGKIDVLFNGTEGTGLQFVDTTMMPVRVRGGTPTDISASAASAPLLYSRNGESGGSAPKFRATLRCDFVYQSEADDEMGFQVRFGSFPSGGSISDIQFQNFSWSITSTGNLD